MLTLVRSDEFDQWLARLRDPIGKARILARLKSVSVGNLGDLKSLGDGVAEMRIHVGPGYRIYYTRRDQLLLLLLCGGDKGSQAQDISRARKIVERWKDELQ